MKLPLLLLLLLFTLRLNAQDYVLKIEETAPGKYKAIVAGYDSLSRMENWHPIINSGKDKSARELLIYDEKNRKREQFIYNNSGRISRHFSWYKTGTLQGDIIWENDSVFIAKGYYNSGKISHLSSNGVHTDYYENGQESAIVNDVAHFQKTFYRTGQLKMEKRDEQKSYKEWHPNGQLKVQGALDNNALGRFGEWLYYNDKGKLIRKLFYEYGKAYWYGKEEGYSKETRY